MGFMALTTPCWLPSPSAMKPMRLLLLRGRGRLLLVLVVLLVVIVDGADDALLVALAERHEAHALRLHDGHALGHGVGRLDEELVEQRARSEAKRQRANDGDPRPRALAEAALVLVVAVPLAAAAAQLAAARDRLAQLA